MRVVIAHDWLTNWHGAEKVLAEMVRVTGAEEVVTAVADRELTDRMLPGVKITTLWPDRLPGASRNWSRYALPLMAAWATVKIEADLLLVSSHFAAHAATVRFQGPSVVYYHSPARILWRPDLELQRLSPPARLLARGALPFLRRYDRWVAQRPSIVIANSSSIAERLKLAYGREAQVIHPPVDVDRWTRVRRGEPRHILWLGRLVGYKEPELAIRSCAAAGIPLVVVGDGPERDRLEALAVPGVTFLGRAPEAVVDNAMARAVALVQPGEEDFGISLVEGQAAGVPVITCDRGGASDTVVDGATGLLVAARDVAVWAAAIEFCAKQPWDPSILRQHASRFSTQVFQERLRALLCEFGGFSDPMADLSTEVPAPGDQPR